MGKYEEALERARAGKPIDEVFLELKESEDERIRKAALKGIEYLEHKLGWDFIGDTDILDVKEYLEKQKEPKPVARKSDFVSKPQTSVEILRHYLVWAVNSEEDCPYTWETLADAISDGIKALEEQKPAEKQDYSGLNDLERAIHRGFLSAGVENVPVTIIKETAQEYLSQMKPAEWSEEDEAAYGDLIWCIEQAKKSAKDENDMGNIWFAENWVKNRLKSLRPWPHWKPSEEHPEGGCSEKPNDLLLEQEPTCKTCDYYENDCPFTRGKLMVYPNKVCKDYTHSAMKQEQLGVRCEPSLPSNLDEAAEEFGKRQGVELAPFARKFFKADAEWVAGQFQKIEGDLVDWHSTSDGKEYCCGIKTDEAFEVPECFYIQKKQQPGESLKENEDGNK